MIGNTLIGVIADSIRFPPQNVSESEAYAVVSANSVGMTNMQSEEFYVIIGTKLGETTISSEMSYIVLGLELSKAYVEQETIYIVSGPVVPGSQGVNDSMFYAIILE